jgi:hypothetical protein
MSNFGNLSAASLIPMATSLAANSFGGNFTEPLSVLRKFDNNGRAPEILGKK